jgi:epsilon-lactone hydrolase
MEEDMTQQSTQTIADERAEFATLLTKPLPDDVIVRDRVLGGRPALEVTVQDHSSEGVLLYLHGGGFTVGSPQVLAALTAQLARRAGVRVVSLDYRLAPEHPFPAAVDDVRAAYRELLDEGVAPDRLAVAGDSAGGNLTLAALVGARDAGLPQPAAAVVFSPWVDMSLSGDTIRTHEQLDPIFDRAALEHYVQYYVGAGDRRNPLASPLFGRLDGLAPLLVQVGGHEVLLDDAVRLAGRVAADGGQVTLQVWAGVPHVFQHHVGLLPEAASALDDAAAFLGRYLGQRVV